MKNQYYIYILGGISDVIEIGITTNPERTLLEKIIALNDSFLDSSLISKIIYLEKWDDRYIAGARETQLKNWKRVKVLDLIENQNSIWEKNLQVSI